MTRRSFGGFHLLGFDGRERDWEMEDWDNLLEDLFCWILKDLG